MLKLLLRRSGTKGTKPTVSKPAAAGEIAQGELWLNNNHETPGLFARADDDSLIEFVSRGELNNLVIYSPTAPTSPPHTLVNGTIWVDTSKHPPEIYAWDSTANKFEQVAGAPKDAPPDVGTVTLADVPGGARFTSQAFPVDVTMTAPGVPVATKKLKAWVEGSLGPTKTATVYPVGQYEIGRTTATTATTFTFTSTPANAGYFAAGNIVSIADTPATALSSTGAVYRGGNNYGANYILPIPNPPGSLPNAEGRVVFDFGTSLPAGQIVYIVTKGKTVFDPPGRDNDPSQTARVNTGAAPTETIVQFNGATAYKYEFGDAAGYRYLRIGFASASTAEVIVLAASTFVAGSAKVRILSVAGSVATGEVLSGDLALVNNKKIYTTVNCGSSGPADTQGALPVTSSNDLGLSGVVVLNGTSFLKIKVPTWAWTIDYWAKGTGSAATGWPTLTATLKAYRQTGKGGGTVSIGAFTGELAWVRVIDGHETGTAPSDTPPLMAGHLPGPSVRMYCTLDGTGGVTGLQSADPGYTAVSGSSPYHVTFPALLPSGAAPDADLPAGTTLTAAVQASNASGNDAANSNTITPA